MVREAPRERPHFFPGSPIATTLVDGDIKMAGIGTVTWVQGDHFLAFSVIHGLGSHSHAGFVREHHHHGGLGIGRKLGRPTTPAGVLTDDRIYAIGGTSAEKASTVPVKVSVAGRALGWRKTGNLCYQTRLLQLPVFAAVVTANT